MPQPKIPDSIKKERGKFREDRAHGNPVQMPKPKKPLQAILPCNRQVLGWFGKWWFGKWWFRKNVDWLKPTNLLAEGDWTQLFLCALSFDRLMDGIIREREMIEAGEDSKAIGRITRKIQFEQQALEKGISKFELTPLDRERLTTPAPPEESELMAEASRI